MSNPVSDSAAIKDSSDEKGTDSGSIPYCEELVRSAMSKMYMGDRRRIDFILVYTEKQDENEGNILQQRRDSYESTLEKLGLILEKEPFLEAEYMPLAEGARKRLINHGLKYFVKVHAPFDVLLNVAEKTKMNLPIAVEMRLSAFVETCIAFMTVIVRSNLDPELFPPRKKFFTAEYQSSLKPRFAPFFEQRQSSPDMKGCDGYFSSAERSRLVRKILNRCPFFEALPSDPNSREQFSDGVWTSKSSESAALSNSVKSPENPEHNLLQNVFSSNLVSHRYRGIDNLLADGTYESAYPLHEPLIQDIEPNALPKELWNPRMKLYWHWAKFSNIFRIQPLHEIRNYFGERIAFYFTWLGWYISMLACPAFLGICVLLYGLITLQYDIPSQEVCDINKAGKFIMCPRLDRQRFWLLQEACTHAKVTYVFDNVATIVFACLMSLWSVFFLCLWERQQDKYKFLWDVHSMVEEAEETRPEYEKMVKATKINPITQEEEPYVSFNQKCFARLRSFTVVIFMVSIVCGIVTGIIVYRLSIKAALNASKNSVILQYSPYIVSSTGALLNLICILTLSMIYERLAVCLTNLEMHRTDSAYEDALTLKLFVFQFVNYYSSLFYIGLYKPSKWWNFMHRHYFLRDAFKQIQLRRRCRKEFSNIGKRPYEQDLLLQPMSATTLFYEYLELVIQYGFITMFIVAFPLAPLFSLLNNLLEIRVDANKFVLEMQRPVAKRTKGIGIWYNILRAISRFALITNALLIAFASDTIPRMVYQHYYSTDGTLKGYVNFTLSYFNINDFQSDDLQGIIVPNITTCRYKDYRYPPSHPNKYKRNGYFYHVMSVKLGFVVIFECCCSLLIELIDYIVRELPASTKKQASIERRIVQNMQWNQDSTHSSQCSS